jgi:pSer/pThr/pTyr-binding forkhead associated (FHA) protein
MIVKLRVVQGKPQGRIITVHRGELVIGRGEECHLRPNSSLVSRQHCLLRVTENAVSLQDMGSANGTLVNGRRVLGKRPLIHGDKIQIGPLVFQICVEEAAPTGPQKVPSSVPVPAGPDNLRSADDGDEVDLVGRATKVNDTDEMQALGGDTSRELAKRKADQTDDASSPSSAINLA